MSKNIGGDAEQLCLFERGGVDLSRLRALRLGLGEARRAAATVTGYSCDWRDFGAWCAEAGHTPLPALPETLDLYITSLLVKSGKRVSTAARRLAAVAHFHRQADLPVPDMSKAREAISLVRRDRREQPVGKAALHPSDLASVCRECDARTQSGARDRAIILLGFASSLRRSELAELQLSDISFEREGLALLVRHSKTDQDGRGRIIGVWEGRRSLTDPVRALKRWIAMRGDWEGPLFCRFRGDGQMTHESISGESVNEIVKRCAEAVGLDASRYGAHSLRAGAVTASAALGRSDQELMGLSGHRSAAMVRRYVRSERIFNGRNPLEGVL